MLEKSFDDALLKFTDSMVASTSAGSEQIQIWEPKTLAPYEPIGDKNDKKFKVAEKTLSLSPNGWIWAAQATKNIMTVWRWDKKEPTLRFPLKEQLSVFKVHNDICIGGSKRGSLTMWHSFSGEILEEIESAHYMEINDADLTSDMIVTAGKDCKIKVWLICNLPSCYHEFGDHQQEVTQVRFSRSGEQRLFSASADKTFRVFDVAEKLCIKVIQAHSSIQLMVVDDSETMVYLACDNQNIYAHTMQIEAQEKSKQKRTLQHKKRVTAMCLSVDGQHLISGDSEGLIYLWSTSKNLTENAMAEPSSGALSNTSQGLISTYELHKDKGPITNLVQLHRPLSLYGLTANMKSYDVQEIKALQKFKQP